MKYRLQLYYIFEFSNSLKKNETMHWENDKIIIIMHYENNCLNYLKIHIPFSKRIFDRKILIT